MAQFMVMVLENEADETQRSPAETQMLVEAHTAYEQKLRALSVYVDGERLRPSSEGRRVSVRDGKPRIEKGPCAEMPFNGYYLVEAASLGGAMQLAEECPMPAGSELEVRPLMKSNLKPEKTSHQGKVFAFAVLGNSVNERGWVDVMERIEACSSGTFPPERTLGGLRLEPPSRGRRVVASGNQRSVFDGPFLESKEVIGGLFFMRMSGVDEAVQWASQTEFVKHGTVEIRELWRS